MIGREGYNLASGLLLAGVSALILAEVARRYSGSPVEAVR
jgi:hypothetical protein